MQNVTQVSADKLCPRSDGLVSRAPCRLLQLRHTLVALSRFEPTHIYTLSHFFRTSKSHETFLNTFLLQLQLQLQYGVR